MSIKTSSSVIFFSFFLKSFTLQVWRIGWNLAPNPDAVTLNVVVETPYPIPLELISERIWIKLDLFNVIFIKPGPSIFISVILSSFIDGFIASANSLGLMPNSFDNFSEQLDA